MSTTQNVVDALPAGGRLVVQDEGGAVVVLAMYRGEDVLRIAVSREALTRYAYRFLAASTRRAPV
jgi:hypothetical protein